MADGKEGKPVEPFVTMSNVREDTSGETNAAGLLTRPLRRRRIIRLLMTLALLLLLGYTLGVHIPALMSSSPPLDMATRTPMPTLTPVSTAVFAQLATHPLHLPVISSAEQCPVTKGRMIDPHFGLAAGSGPLYIMVVLADGTVAFTPASEWGDHIGWGGMPQTFWLVPGTFAGPLLVRGQRLDAPGPVRFNEPSGPLLTEVQMVVDSSPLTTVQAIGGWYIRFNAPGCYGFQIDGLARTEVIVFWAKPMV